MFVNKIKVQMLLTYYIIADEGKFEYGNIEWEINCQVTVIQILDK